jgi:putative hemolysin
MELARIVSAEMLPGLRLTLRFADGGEGVAELAPLVTTGPALAAIAANPAGFTIAQGGRAIAWQDADGEEVDLCADALRRLIGTARAAAE